jgi:hypothetical protein
MRVEYPAMLIGAIQTACDNGSQFIPPTYWLTKLTPSQKLDVMVSVMYDITYCLSSKRLKKRLFEANRVDIIKWFDEQGVITAQYDNIRNRLLESSIYYGSMQIMQYLLSKADLGLYRDGNAWYPLCLAMTYPHDTSHRLPGDKEKAETMALEIMKHQAVSLEWKYAPAPDGDLLTLALQRGLLQIADKIVQKNPRFLNKVDRYGSTVLFQALSNYNSTAMSHDQPNSWTDEEKTTFRRIILELAKPERKLITQRTAEYCEYSSGMRDKNMLVFARMTQDLAIITAIEAGYRACGVPLVNVTAEAIQSADRARMRLAAIIATYSRENRSEGRPVHITILLHRYLTGSIGQRGGISEIMSAVNPVLDYLAREPHHLCWIEETAGAFLDGCVNQPVAGWSEITAWLTVAKASTITAKLEAARQLMALGEIKEVVSKQSPGANVEIEAGNALLREVHKRLVDDGTIKTPWPGVPGPIAYEGTIMGWLTAQRINDACAEVKKVLAKPVADVVNYLCETHHQYTWSTVAFPKEIAAIKKDYDKKITHATEAQMADLQMQRSSAIANKTRELTCASLSITDWAPATSHRDRVMNYRQNHSCGQCRIM